jgi:hypothetical protein
MKQSKETRFVVCIENAGVPASLELRKIDEVIPDEEAATLGQLRVIDESGEDYLFPQEYFSPIDLPEHVQELLRRISGVARE